MDVTMDSLVLRYCMTGRHITKDRSIKTAFHLVFLYQDIFPLGVKYVASTVK